MSEADCTFIPKINEKSRKLGRPGVDAKTPLDATDKDYLFMRLFRDGERKQKFTKQLEYLKLHREQKGCTF